MSNPSNVEQFNAQVKRMSERLRGESASPPDTQGADKAAGDGNDQQGTEVINTQSNASQVTTSQGKKKSAGGRKGATSSKSGGQSTTAPSSTRPSATSKNNQTGSFGVSSRDGEPPIGATGADTTEAGDRATIQEEGESATVTPDTIPEKTAQAAREKTNPRIASPEDDSPELGSRATNVSNRDGLIAAETLSGQASSIEMSEQAIAIFSPALGDAT